jgi:branched-chain amino acid aminotransferase
MSHVWLNDSLAAEEEARVSTADRGFTLGDGIFETMRVTNGKVFRLSAHLERLRRSATRIGVPCPDSLEHAIAVTLAANSVKEGALRLTLTRGESDRGLRIPAGITPTLVIRIDTFMRDERADREGVRASLLTARLNEHAASAGIKHLGYLEAILAQREAAAAGVEEALLLDTAGHLTEAAAANLFLVVDSGLLTPPLECGVLPGITRAAVLEIASRTGLPWKSEPLLPDALMHAQEAFLTSSLRGLTPLVAVDGNPIGTGGRGPITSRLQDAYQKLVTAETQDLQRPANNSPEP